MYLKKTKWKKKIIPSLNMLLYIIKPYQYYLYTVLLG